MGLANNHPSGTFRVRNLATGEVVCRQDLLWHPAAAEESHEHDEKGRNAEGSDESVYSANGTGEFGTVHARVELQQGHNVPQGENQQPESIEEQSEEEEQEQPEQRGQPVLQNP